MTWNDLLTSDAETASRFYEELFGWSVEEVPGAGGYRVIRNGERSNGAIMPLDPQATGGSTPPHWIPYFGHEDVDRVVAEAPASGARVVFGPMRIPQGSIAVLADPQGATFSLWTGEYDD